MNIRNGLNNAYNFFTDVNNKSVDHAITGTFICFFGAACYLQRPVLAAIILMRVLRDFWPVPRAPQTGINLLNNQAQVIQAPVYYAA